MPDRERRERKRDYRGRRPRRKIAAIRAADAKYVDYKDVMTLRRYMSDRGKILPRRVTGNSAKVQRAIAQAIKRARELALLPYTSE